jgi:hypothetical protein
VAVEEARRLAKVTVREFSSSRLSLTWPPAAGSVWGLLIP